MFLIVSWRKCRLPAVLLAAVLLAGTLLPRAAVVTAQPTDPGVAVPIIMYHSILKDAARQGAYIISPTQFEQDLQYIQAAGYTTVVIQDLLDYVDRGTPLPEKPIILTFDDGYYNNYHYAHPLLRQYGMRAVISPVAYWSEHYSARPEEQDRPAYSHLTWAQLREMVDSGVWEIQNHSYDLHHNQQGKRKGASKRSGESEDQYRQVLTADLAAAQDLLTRQVGVTPTAFTYPFGAISKQSVPLLREMGFRATLSCESRVSRITRSPDSLWQLGRYLRPAGVDSKTYFDPIFQRAEE